MALLTVYRQRGMAFNQGNRKAGNRNEMETGNGNWKWKLEMEIGNGNRNKNAPITGAMFSSWTHEQCAQLYTT